MSADKRCYRCGIDAPWAREMDVPAHELLCQPCLAIYEKVIQSISEEGKL